MGCVTSLEETQSLSSDLKSTILERSIRTILKFNPTKVLKSDGLQLWAEFVFSSAGL